MSIIMPFSGENRMASNTTRRIATMIATVQVKPADRWAIVAYIRALQKTRTARLEDIPAEEREALR